MADFDPDELNRFVDAILAADTDDIEAAIMQVVSPMLTPQQRAEMAAYIKPYRH